MKSSESHITLFLSSIPFFKGLPVEYVQKFVAASEIRDHQKGQSLFMAGDKATLFFVILNGWMKLFRSTIGGEEAVLSLLTRGDVFGEAACFESTDYPFSAEVAESTRLLEVPAFFLKEMARQNPEIQARVMSSMSRQIQKLQIENEHLSIMTAPQRVGCLLLQLASGMVGRGGAFTFPYDKSLAAARLGMKPETFSRALSQLRPYGVIVKGSEIQVENFQNLSRYVCTHCSLQDSECLGAQEISRCCGSRFCEKKEGTKRL